VNAVSSRVLKKFTPFLLLVLLLASCGQLRNQDSIKACQELVKDRLSAPSTAKFVDVAFKDIDGKTFEVLGKFDAQNGFGAFLRGSFKCMGFEGGNLRLIYVN
jgi:hypothetical protein